MRARRTTSELMRWILGSLIAFAVVVGMSSITGCGNTPTGPVDQDHSLSALQFVDQQSGAGEPLVSDSAYARVLEGLLHDLTSLLVGPGGGTLEVQLGDNSGTLRIPPGALRRLVRITMGALQHETPWNNATIFEFGPDGLVFILPAMLTLETDRPDGTLLRIYWWNPDKRVWVFQQAATVRDGRVSFMIRHFSKYGIA